VKYEVRLDDETGQFGIFDTVESRYTGRFGRGEDARIDAEINAERMNEDHARARRERDVGLEDEEPVSLHGARLRSELLKGRDARGRPPAPF
jgi:hypothetical protein